MFLMKFFSENEDFMRETKIVPQEEKYIESETSSRKVTILQMREQPHGKRRPNAKFRTFYWKSRGETNSI
jgi:hypothetical protein